MQEYFYDPYAGVYVDDYGNPIDIEETVHPRKQHRTKHYRNAFVKTGRTLLQMQRPHLDADALVSKLSNRGIRAVRRAMENRQSRVQPRNI